MFRNIGQVFHRVLNTGTQKKMLNLRKCWDFWSLRASCN